MAELRAEAESPGPFSIGSTSSDVLAILGAPDNEYHQHPIPPLSFSTTTILSAVRQEVAVQYP